MRRAAVSLLLCAWSLLAAPVAQADELQDRFDTVWESLWYQGGTPLLVARWAGDEFLVLLDGLDRADSAARVVEKLRAAFAEPIQSLPPEASQALGVSIGLAVYPENGTDVNSLVQQADAAMYREKQARGRKAPDA